MKVAMWTSWGTRCGIASYTGSLVEALRELGVEVAIVSVPYTDRDATRFAETVRQLNDADLVHVQHEYTFFGGIAPGSSTLLDYYARINPPRVVTAHTVFSAAELLRLAQETRWRQRQAKRLLAALPGYRRSVERRPFAGAAGVIVHTAAARERMLSRGIAPERLHVLPAGVPKRSSASPADVEAFRERFDLRGRRVLTLFGYITADKGYEVALEAVKSLPPVVKLLIAGGTRVEGERGYLDQLRETIRAQGLENRVAITGYLEEDEIAAAMGATDVVLVPHTTANGSYSVMVGLSYGKPLVASDLPCFRELAEEAGCVELFEVGDERTLAERAGFLLASASARERLAAGARAFAERRSWAAVAQETREIYRTALRR